MLTWLRKTRRVLRPRTRWQAFRSTQPIYREHFRYALRRTLWPEIKLCLWVTSRSSRARFFLSDDPTDDAIAQDLASQPGRLFPDPCELGARAGIIVDIGGHHGLYAVEALRRYPDRNIIIVEPHPLWCDLIRKNLGGNGGGARARVVNACLAEDCGRRTLRFDPDSSWGATVHPGGHGLLAVQVESLPLPDILNGETVAMIYCNAEGAEYTLVSQLCRYGIRPTVIVMCVHPEYGDAEALRQQARDLGYTERNASANLKRPVFHYKLKGEP